VNELLSAISNRTEVAYDAVWLQLYPGYQAWMNDDVAIASRELARAEHNPMAQNGVDDPLAFAEFHQALGQTRQANSWLREVSISRGYSDLEFYFATLALTRAPLRTGVRVEPNRPPGRYRRSP
jgi:hypothetical protein